MKTQNGNAIAELFAAFAAPFPADQIKTRPGRGGTKLSWVPASAVASRLNTLLPGQWEFEVQTVLNQPNVVKGELTLHLPDGTTRMWSQFGYPNSDSDEEPLKSAATDALRRAAAFGPGIGLDLYGGVSARPVVAPAQPTGYNLSERAAALEAELIQIVDTLVNKHEEIDTGIKIITALSKEHVGRAGNLPLPKLETWVAAARKRLAAAQASGKVVA